uniref:Uncharacterized protein n=1 Tax=Rhizophora mucronata TaxID=61149 RepID=A0A2P2NB55_RHIMU
MNPGIQIYFSQHFNEDQSILINNVNVALHANPPKFL